MALPGWTMSITSGRPLRKPYMTLGRPAPLSMRMPIRWSLPRRSEALKAMQVMGLLERSRTGGGLAARGNHVWFTIAPLSTYLATRSHLVEQVEVRRMIEPEMGRLAAERATAEHLVRIEHCLLAMEADIDAGGLGAEADAAFHAAIAASTNNELLTRIVELIGDAIREHREIFQTLDGARESLAEHREILNAIRRGDG